MEKECKQWLCSAGAFWKPLYLSLHVTLDMGTADSKMAPKTQTHFNKNHAV